MIKRIFITLFVFFYIGTNVFASNLPYTNNSLFNFESIIGTSVFNHLVSSIILSPDKNTMFYRSGIDGHIYKKDVNTSNLGLETQVTTSPGTPYYMDGTNIYYKIDNGPVYKKGINEVGDGTIFISSNQINAILFSQTGEVFYNNYNNGWKLYRTHINTGGDGVQMTTYGTEPKYIDNFTQEVYFTNWSDGKMYKKGFYDLGGGTLIDNTFYNQFTVSSDGQTVVYRNIADNYNLYKKGINEIGDGVKFENFMAFEPKFSSDGNYIIFRGDSGMPLYKKAINGNTPAVKLGDASGTNFFILGEYVYYPAMIGGKLYNVNINNPQGYAMTDNTYKSVEITNSDTGVYIKTDTTLPTGTDYEFWLANQNTQQVAVNEGGDTYLMMGTRLDDWSGMINFTTLGLNVGDEIVIYKGGSEATTIITQINSMEIRFNNTVLSDDMGYGIKKGSANFQKLNNAVLDGDTEINTQTVFGATSSKLFYQIVLSSNDNMKTPVINSVNITATPQTIITSPTGGGENTATGGINLSLGDGSSISIPVEKQTTDFIKTIATKPSINPASLNNYNNVETFLKDNNYDYTNQLLIGSGSIPSLTMYNVVNLGLTNTSLSDTLSGAINSPSYAKLVLGQDTYLAGKRIINYLKMDKADDNGNLIISVYKPDTKEYIFLRKKD